MLVIERIRACAPGRRRAAENPESAHKPCLGAQSMGAVLGLGRPASPGCKGVRRHLPGCGHAGSRRVAQDACPGGAGAGKRSSYKEAPHQYLAAVTKAHDRYWDIPLNQNLPHPGIDLPEVANSEPGTASSTATANGLPFTAHRSPSARKLFDFQTTAAPAGVRDLLAEQPRGHEAGRHLD